VKVRCQNEKHVNSDELSQLNKIEEMSYKIHPIYDLHLENKDGFIMNINFQRTIEGVTIYCGNFFIIIRKNCKQHAILSQNVFYSGRIV